MSVGSVVYRADLQTDRGTALALRVDGLGTDLRVLDAAVSQHVQAADQDREGVRAQACRGRHGARARELRRCMSASRSICANSSFESPAPARITSSISFASR